MKIGKPSLSGRGGRNNFAILSLFCVIAATVSSAQSFTTLATFDGINGQGLDGVTQGFDGNLYGTTLGGGTSGVGTVFVFSRTGSLETLYSFCPSSQCAGYEPAAGMIQGKDGNFYGTTSGWRELRLWQRLRSNLQDD